MKTQDNYDKQYSLAPEQGFEKRQGKRECDNTDNFKNLLKTLPYIYIFLIFKETLVSNWFYGMPHTEPENIFLKF